MKNSAEHHDRLEIETFGFWVYLMSDLVLFAILFSTFIVLSRNYANGPEPRQLFDLRFLFIETMLLLTSSVAYGCGMVALQQKKINPNFVQSRANPSLRSGWRDWIGTIAKFAPQGSCDKSDEDLSALRGNPGFCTAKSGIKRVLSGLIVAFLLGLGFVSMELNEFHRMIVEGHGPSQSGFLSSFFALVGTHGTHVTFGLIWIAVMVIQVLQKGPTDAVRSRLTRLGMFWHFLDIVWVGVFTVVYLAGVL